MMNGRRSMLEVAIEQGNWELAALCLLNGVAEAVEKFPPEAIDELLDMLAGLDEPAPRRKHRKKDRRGRHG